MPNLTLRTQRSGGRTTTKQVALNTPVAAGCVALFLLPFAAAGAFTAVKAVQMGMRGAWHDAVLYGAFALTFGGIGFGGLAGIRVAYRKLKDVEALQKIHPDEPWLWRPDWASGRIDDSTQENLLGAWIMAALWNLVSLPSAFFAVRAAVYEGKTAAYVALLFPLVGVWLLARAVQTTLRYRKYGVSRFDLSTIPGVIGHHLDGRVRATLDLQPAEGFQVSLTCLRRVTTRSGKSSSTRDTILWQDERRVQGEQSRDYTGMGVNIPVSFALPPDAVASDASNPNDRVVWRLEISAGLPGVDYDSTFEVPVFRTAASEPASAEESETSLAAYHQPANSPIAVTASGGRTEILFPAARNLGAAAGLTVFTLIWWGTVGIQLYLHAPIIFPIVTAVFGLLLLFGAANLWLKVSKVTVAAGGVTLASGYLYPGRERRLAAGEIAGVTADIGMQQGTTPYYDVTIRLKDGKKLTAGNSVRDKREAEWLAATIRNAAGL
jgi:hypothetical protein